MPWYFWLGVIVLCLALGFIAGDLAQRRWPD